MTEEDPALFREVQRTIRQEAPAAFASIFELWLGSKDPAVRKDAPKWIRNVLHTANAAMEAGETVRSAQRFRIAKASLALRRAEPVEVWIGASAAPAIDLTARLAEGWIASPSLTYQEARAQADLYRERCAAYGKAPGAIVLRRDVYVGESSTEAQAVLQQALGCGYRGMPAEALIAGTADEVAEKFGWFAAIGYDEILVRHLTNGQPKFLGSLERLARVRAALA